MLFYFIHVICKFPHNTQPFQRQIFLCMFLAQISISRPLKLFSLKEKLETPYTYMQIYIVHSQILELSMQSILSRSHPESKGSLHISHGAVRQIDTYVYSRLYKIEKYCKIEISKKISTLHVITHYYLNFLPSVVCRTGLNRVNSCVL